MPDDSTRLLRWLFAQYLLSLTSRMPIFKYFNFFFSVFGSCVQCG
uniref:Transcription initiation factor TFIID subunit 2 isoform X2 n=1 Tax=Rhizophora mucronata TaxID=61149 RepID=A0A2P2MHM7_RHIMU